jgi:CRISPR-associated exonuclease Cas4
MIRATDLKQYVYCPRIVFYNYCLPVEKKTTWKMDVGTELHDVIEQLESRRKLKRYNLTDGERRFGVWLVSEHLGLSGKIDMVIFRGLQQKECDGRMVERVDEAIPVDFKHTFGRPQKNHLYQLTGYALLLEETYGCTVDRGFIYLIPAKDAVVCEIDADLKEEVRQAVREIETMIRNEAVPPPTPHRNRCWECEYRNFCDDVF